MSTRRRVFVRGWGAVTPLGATWDASFAALEAGRSAIAPIASFDATRFPCTVAAALSPEIEARVPEVEGGDRRLRLAWPAARAAWAQAALEVAPERVGVFVGAESGRASLSILIALARAAGGAGTFDHRRFGREAAPLAARLAPGLLSPASVASDRKSTRLNSSHSEISRMPSSA